MSNIFDIFSSGISGLNASQAGIDVTGHNIANVNNKNYSRQRISLSTESPNITATAAFGRGVHIDSVQRVYNETLASNIRAENAQLEYYNTLQTNLSQVQIYFNEFEEGSGLQESLKEYFNAWQDLSNTAPDSSDEAMVKREALMQKAQMFTAKINESYDAIENIRDTSDYNIQEYAAEINTISKSIAELNYEISKIENVGGHANDYRDERDGLLKRMSELANINVYEQPRDGQVSVYLAGNALVDDNISFKLMAEHDTENAGHVKVTWGTQKDTTGQQDITDMITGGKMGAELNVRDEMLTGYQADLDTLASTIITETNAVHAMGVGLERLTETSSSNGVINPSYTLDEEVGAFPFEVNEGTIRIGIYDESGDWVENYDIDIDPENDTLNSIIYKIDSADGDGNGGKINCQISKSNTFEIFSETGYTFSFEEDTTNLLVASGINGFFEGTDASTIKVNEDLVNNTDLIATGKSGAEGDNTNALEISNLKFKSVYEEKNITIEEFYTFFAAKIGSDKHNIDLYVTTKQTALNELELKLEEIKGVSMDEELTSLLKFQRSYEASARFITTVDQMVDKLINGLGLVGR